MDAGLPQLQLASPTCGFACVLCFASYVSARMYKQLKGGKWAWNIILTNVVFPGAVWTCYCCCCSWLLLWLVGERVCACVCLGLPRFGSRALWPRFRDLFPHSLGRVVCCYFSWQFLCPSASSR